MVMGGTPLKARTIMGLETTCRAEGTVGAGRGRLLLETDELLFRGPPRVRISFRDILRVTAVDGVLAIEYAGGSMRFAVGAAAPRWAEKITSPPSRLAKMGIKAGLTVSVIGLEDREFAAELAASGARVSTGRVVKGADVIVFGVDRQADLDRLALLGSKLDPAGGIWVIHRKGKDGVKDVDIFAAGRRVGLTANKVARFSDTHTAERLVIPKALRK